MTFKYRKPGARRHIVEVPCRLATREALFDALAAAIPLPDYFGRNWDALEECLSDLSFVAADVVELVHLDLPALGDDDLTIYLEILSSAVAAAEARRGAPELEVVFLADVREAVARLLADTDTDTDTVND